MWITQQLGLPQISLVYTHDFPTLETVNWHDPSWTQDSEWSFPRVELWARTDLRLLSLLYLFGLVWVVKTGSTDRRGSVESPQAQNNMEMVSFPNTEQIHGWLVWLEAVFPFLSYTGYWTFSMIHLLPALSWRRDRSRWTGTPWSWTSWGRPSCWLRSPTPASPTPWWPTWSTGCRGNSSTLTQFRPGI